MDGKRELYKSIMIGHFISYCISDIIVFAILLFLGVYICDKHTYFALHGCYYPIDNVRIRCSLPCVTDCTLCRPLLFNSRTAHGVLFEPSDS